LGVQHNLVERALEGKVWRPILAAVWTIGGENTARFWAFLGKVYEI